MVKKNCCFVDVRVRAEVEDLQGKCKEKTKAKGVNKDPRWWSILPLDHTVSLQTGGGGGGGVSIPARFSGSSGVSEASTTTTTTKSQLHWARLSPSQRLMFTSQQGEENPRRRLSSLDAFLCLLFLNGAEHPELSSCLNRCVLNSDGFPSLPQVQTNKALISSSPSRWSASSRVSFCLTVWVSALTPGGRHRLSALMLQSLQVG